MRFLILFASFFCVYTASGQRLQGTLRADDGQAVAFAAVTLHQASDSTLVKAIISKADGSFRFDDLESGEYTFRVQVLGFEPLERRIVFSGTSRDLGTIQMQQAAEKLEQVTVTAEKPMIQVQADKTIFNVENTINATNTSAFELLRKAPGVIVDNGGGIILEGKSGVQFFIDGRLSVLQGEDLISYLESLQATDIESVEIITQPSSKYDAAGNAGIINIVLKKDKSIGTNGTITSGVTIGNFKRWNSSINFNSRGRKGNLYGSYSNRYGKSAGFLNLLRTQSGNQFDARTRSTFDRNTNNIRLGYDYYLNSRHTLGVIANGNFNNNYGNSDSRTPIYPVGAPSPDSVLIAENRSSNQSYNTNVNLNYRYKDTLGTSLNIDLDYGKYNSDRVAFQPNLYLNGSEDQVISERISRQLTPIDIDILTGKADYEQNFIGGKLALGFKLSYVETDNIFDFFQVEDGEDILDPMQSNRFRYTENIYAAYVNYNLKWKQWNLQTGLRVENTDSDGQLISRQENADNRVERNYTNLFPSGGLTYQLNRKNQLALLYSKRIQRPNYASLNPFEFQIDELSSRKGNPFLQPQYTDNLKLSHTYNYRLTTSLSYSYVSDFFAQVTVAEGATENFITVRNVADLETWNLGVSYPKQLTSWWNLYVSLNGFVNSYKANSPEFLPVTQQTLSGYMQHTFSLPGDLRFEVSGWYSSPSVWGGTYQTRALGSLNVAVQKKFLDERLTARLAFNDILYTVPWRGTTQFGELFIDGSGGSDSRQVAFALTYDFGRSEIKKARNRKTGLEEEKGRIE